MSMSRPDPSRATSVAGPMISYAQNAEDVVLQRAFAGQTTGFYIDLGANHPVVDSVTKHFYDHGWRGINVEPQIPLYQELQRQRPRDINVNVGVSDTAGRLTIHVVTDVDGLTTFDDSLAERHRQAGYTVTSHTVEVVTLADIVARHVTGPVDFLKVDVEGFEAQVLRGADWSSFRPRVIVLETNYVERWEHLVDQAGYDLAVFDGLNRFYVRREEGPEFRARLDRPAVLALDQFRRWDQMSEVSALRTEIDRLARRLEHRGAILGPASRALGSLRHWVTGWPWLRRLAGRAPRPTTDDH